MDLIHISLCSGIGGIDLAAEWAGFATVAQCEIDDYASLVLAKNFKGVPNLHDIRTVDNALLREHGIDTESVTLLSAGFPCQPYSLAGKGRGDGDERDLWGEVKRCIGEIKPRWFVGENTPGLFARANQRYFKRILTDLTEMGYRVSWGIWGACDVGAPHERKRVFLCAYNAASERRNAIEFQDGEFSKAVEETSEWESSRASSVHGKIPDTMRERSMDERTQIHTAESWKSSFGDAIKLHSAISDTASDKLGVLGSSEETAGTESCGTDNGIRAQENASGEWWQTQPDVGRVVNGISNRVDKLRCLGNAVVPQQIYPLLQAIADYERSSYESEF